MFFLINKAMFEMISEVRNQLVIFGFVHEPFPLPPHVGHVTVLVLIPPSARRGPSVVKIVPLPSQVPQAGVGRLSGKSQGMFVHSCGVSDVLLYDTS